MMLDTNIVADLIRNPHGRAALHLRQHGAEGICLSIITAAELRYGAAKKGSTRMTRRVEAILSMIDVLPFDAPADAEYGRIRAALEAGNRPIGPTDLFIAAHAYSMDLTLVTAHIMVFGRVQGLKIENWLA